MKTDLLFSSFPFISSEDTTLSQMQITDSDALNKLFEENGLNYNPAAYLQSLEGSFSSRRYIELGFYKNSEPNVLLGTVKVGSFDKDVNAASLDFLCLKGQEEAAAMALAVLIKHLFERIQLNRLYASACSPSAEWCRTLERCGLSREACLRDSLFVPEKGLCDAVTYGILSRDYPLISGSVLIARQDPLMIVRMTGNDYEQMAKWLTDERVLKYYEGRDNPHDLPKVIEVFQPLVTGKDEAVPCIIRMDGRSIGYIQFYPILSEELKELKVEDYHKPYGVDLFIGERDCRNRGIGPRVLRLLCRYLFEELGADVVVGDPQAWNLRSINAFAAAGFSQECILPDHELHEGKMEANVIMHRKAE